MFSNFDVYMIKAIFFGILLLVFHFLWMFILLRSFIFTWTKLASLDKCIWYGNLKIGQMVSIVHNFTKNNFSLQRTKYSGSWSTERASKLLLGCICSYSIQACCLTKILFKKRKLKTQTSFVFLKKNSLNSFQFHPLLKYWKLNRFPKTLQCCLFSCKEWVCFLLYDT